MNGQSILFSGEALELLPSGAFYWPSNDLLVVSDLHLGKSERVARLGGALLPPYETTDTLTRLAADIDRSGARNVLCLGDSFDDAAAAVSLEASHRATIATLQAGRKWIWIEGNHDPGVHDLGGSYLAELRYASLVFRHIARTPCEGGEISGHYHPKARVRSASRPCFLVDSKRLMLPAYGCYTGGLNWTSPAIRGLFSDQATAYLTGQRVLAVPLPVAA
ncbi:MAG: ligase-associated DNA damage response endonuclease PdeM [Silicimonas sp.]|nr:ligase-associated DNA damage response endonuclease PdeM [Silicimonas sp.]